MEGVNKKYYIELEVLTPLNIGAGAEKDWVKGADFVVKDQILYKLNLRKMANAGFDLGPLSSYFAKKDALALLRLIGNRLAEVSDFSMQIPVDSDNDIKSFVKNQLSGNPILAGSSLKGAVRSVLFDYLRDKEQKEQEVFGSSVKGDEFMRFVKFSDVEFEHTELVNTKIFNLRKSEGTWLGGWKHAQNSTDSHFAQEGFNTLYEVLMPNQKSFGNILLSEKVFENFDFTSFYNNEKKQAERLNDIIKKKNVLNSIDCLSDTIEKKFEIIHRISTLFKIINEHTKEYLQKEKAFFQKYPAENSDQIIASIGTLLQKIPTDNSFCIFKMSAGSGFHSITGDWQFDDYTINGLDTSKKVSQGLYNGHKSAKSRKIAVYDDAFSLMGFVKMSILTEEQVKEYVAQKEARRQQKEFEKALAEQERLDALKQQEEERKKISDYNEAIDAANQLFDGGDLGNALTEFQRAEKIFLKGTKHADKIAEIEKELLAIRQQRDFEEQQRRQAEEAAQHRQVQIESGLIFLEEKNLKDEYKVVDFKGAKSRIEQWLKKSENSLLPEGQDEILIAALQRIYQTIKKDKERQQWTTFKEGIWRDVIKWIGESRAKQIYDRIFS